MNHKWEEWMQTKLRPALRKDRLITILLAGVLILVISLPAGKKEAQKKDVTDKSKLTEGEMTAWVEGEADGKQAFSSEETYVRELEERLQKILGSIDGIGDVTVMITLEQTRELVLEKEQKKLQKQTEELSSGESVKSGWETSTEESVAYAETGKEREPVVIKQIYPKVEGVIVVAEGVENGNLKAEITQAIQALFGLEAHKIKVLRMGHISSHAGIE